MSNRKIGVFGGTFDPFHFGHLNSALSVAEAFSLDSIRIVPSSISPLRIQTQSSPPEHRLEMIRLGIHGHESLMAIDTCELDRGGVSFTIDTLTAIRAQDPAASLYLIIGMDQFTKFDQWKDFANILSLADLVVTTRPGMELPFSLEDWPTLLRNMVVDSDSRQAMLKSGRTIYFFKLDDVEASGTEIRKKIRLGQSVQSLVPSPVEEYIRAHHLYQTVQRSIGDFEKFTSFCKKLLEEKGGVNVASYDLRARSAPSEFTLIASGTSTRHASALADHLMKEVKKEYGVWPENIEGQGEGRWVVIDYGALIIHTFYDFVRQEYRLEELWTKPVKK